MLKLKTPVLWPSDAKSQLIGKDLDAGKIEHKGSKGLQRMRWLDSITNPMDMNLSKPQEIVKDEAWCTTVHRLAKSWTQLIDRTTTTSYFVVAA